MYFESLTTDIDIFYSLLQVLLDLSAQWHGSPLLCKPFVPPALVNRLPHLFVSLRSKTAAGFVTCPHIVSPESRECRWILISQTSRVSWSNDWPTIWWCSGVARRGQHGSSPTASRSRGPFAEKTKQTQDILQNIVWNTHTATQFILQGFRFIIWRSEIDFRKQYFLHVKRSH